MYRFRPGILVILVSCAATFAFAKDPPGAKQTTSEKPELHVVGVYESAGGKASVKVDRPGKLVTLVLSSYEPVTWDVSVAPNSQVAQVVLGGYHRQAVKGLPDGVQIVEAFYKGGDRTKRFHHSYSIDSAYFRPMVRALHRLTGLQISSFQGTYASDPDAPFVIDRLQSDPRLQSDYPKPTPIAELPKLEFSALHLTMVRRLDVAAAFGDFTLAGPKVDSLKPLPKGVTRLAVDPAGKKYYGLTGHAVVEVDLEKQTATKLDLGLDVPELSWPCGIAFDTKRQRLIVVSLGGVGYMYAYSPKTGKWSVIADMNNLDLAALAYDPEEDALYGLEQTRGEDGEGGLPMLYQFNAEGALIKEFEFGAPMFPGILGRGPTGVTPQLAAVDGRLVVLASPTVDDSEEVQTERFIFLVDVRAERMWLTAKD